MTAIAGSARETPFAGLTPARGTFNIKANVLIKKGAQVGLDSAGRVMPADTIAAGCLMCIGKASATYDNRTGSALGGLADACTVEVEFGVFGYVTKTGGGDDIAAANVGSPCFAVDDQTVALTSNADARPISGMIVDVTTVNGHLTIWVYQGPHVGALVSLAAADEADLDTAQADIATLQTQVAALIVDATTTKKCLPLPIFSSIDTATGALLAVFADGASTTPGTQLTDSKAVSVRWNNHATPGAIAITVPMPEDLNDADAVVLHILASKIGATLADATKFTVGAFEQAVGALHDADTDFGGDSSAMTGDAVSKTVQEVTLTLAAADVHAAPEAMTFTIKPKAGTLGTDDVCLLAAWLEYTKKEMAS